MSITQTTMEHPVLVLIVFTLFGAVGLFVLRKVSVGLFPDVDSPYVSVNTSYPKAGPESVEKTITKVLEGQLVSVNGLKNLYSSSSENSSNIQLEFNYGVDIDKAVTDVRDKLDRVTRNLPDDAGSPTIFRMNSDSMPIMRIAVRGNRSVDDLKQIAEDSICDILEQADGVAEAAVYGGKTKVVRVELSQNRLASYGFTVTDVSNSLSKQNLELGGGKLNEGARDYTVRTTGEYPNIESINNTVIKRVKGYDVKLSDVGRAFMGFNDSTREVSINGTNGLYVSVTKQSGSNSVAVANEVYKKMSQLGATLPADISMTIIRDDTDQIRETINTLVESAGQGLILAVIVLFVFLQNFKSTIIISISIPLSILITLLAMTAAGITLNMMTLTGLILGVGMIVDASIVMIENIYSYRARGTRPKVASVLGSQEMIGSVLSGNLTTICVFVPFLLYIKELGMMGQMFKGIIFTIVIALVSSLLVAMFLVPVLAGVFLPLSCREQKPVTNPILILLYGAFQKVMGAITVIYQHVLAVCLRYKLTTIIIATCILAVCVALIGTMRINMMPVGRDDSVTLNITLPIGTPIDKTKVVAKAMEDIIVKELSKPKVENGQHGGQSLKEEGGKNKSGQTNDDLAKKGLNNKGADTLKTDSKEKMEDMTKDAVNKNDIKNTQGTTAQDSNNRTQKKGYKTIITTVGGGGRNSSDYKASIQISLAATSEQLYSASEIQGIWRKYFGDFPGVRFSFQAGTRGQMTGDDIDIALRSDDLNALLDVADKIDAAMNTVSDIGEPTISIDKGLPQVEVIIDRERAYQFGVDVGSVAREINYAINGVTSTIYREGGKDYDVDVLYRKEDRKNVNDLENIFVTGSNGRVSVANFATLKRGLGPVTIKRENQTRIVHVTASIKSETNANIVEEKIKEAIAASFIIPDNVSVSYEGSWKDVSEQMTIYSAIIAMAIILVFGVMAATYESFKAPLINLATIPFMIIGVVILYKILNEPLSVMSMVGLIMLVGIVVNNGIILVDYTNLLRARGKSLEEACLEAGVSRLRPVLMTTLTTILGMIPMCFASEGQAAMVRPIGIAVVGGLTSSTFVTLLVIPCLYAIVMREKRIVEELPAGNSSTLTNRNIKNNINRVAIKGNPESIKTMDKVRETNRIKEYQTKVDDTFNNPNETNYTNHSNKSNIARKPNSKLELLNSEKSPSTKRQKVVKKESLNAGKIAKNNTLKAATQEKIVATSKNARVHINDNNIDNIAEKKRKSTKGKKDKEGKGKTKSKNSKGDKNKEEPKSAKDNKKDKKKSKSAA